MSDRLGEFWRLYRDLLTPTKVSGGGQRGQGAERPLTLGGDAQYAREAVARMVGTWTDELDALAGQVPWGQVRTIGRWMIPPPLAAARWVEPAKWPARNVAAMSARLRLQLPRLLADADRAHQLVHDVDVAYEEARRRAYPAAPIGNVIGHCPIGTPAGPCGGMVRATIDTLDESGWAVCGACKTGGVIAWWLETMPREEREFMGMKELRWHLLIRCGRQIAESTIRSWADSDDGEGEPVLRFVCELKTQRRLFRAEDARGLAEMYRRRGRPSKVAS